MDDVVYAIEEYEAIVQEYSSRIYRVGISDELALDIVKSYPEHREDLGVNLILITPPEPALQRAA